MNRLIITGGGTGGHIYPAISIAKYALKNDIDVLYVGRENGLEERVAEKYKVPFRGIPAASLHIKSIKSIPGKIAIHLKSLLKTIGIVMEFKPYIALGTGGYVSGPVLFICELMGIPVLLQEQNVLPGKTNRILSYFSDRIFLPFEKTRKYFKKNNKKVCVTGNPLRDEFERAEQSNLEAARQKLSIPGNSRTVMVFGGSQGSKGINALLSSSIERFLKHDDIFIFWITGDKAYRSPSSRVRVFSYIEEIYPYMLASDLVVSRAGAIALCEISALKKPSILIPYPYAAENHQLINARYFESRGAAKVLCEENITPEIFYRTVAGLLKNDDELKRMQRCSGRLHINNATEKIYKEIKNFL